MFDYRALYRSQPSVSVDFLRVMQRDEYSIETLEQKKSNSCTPVGPTKDRVSSPNQLDWMFLRRSLHWVLGPTSRLAIREGSKDINPDWVNKQTCRTFEYMQNIRITNKHTEHSHNIHVVSGSFIKNDYFSKLIRKICRPTIFLNLNTKSP